MANRVLWTVILLLFWAQTSWGAAAQPDAWPPPPERKAWCPPPGDGPRNANHLTMVTRYLSWSTVESAGARVHTVRGCPGYPERQAILEAHQKALSRIEAFFERKLTKKVDVFVFPDQPPSRVIRDGTVWPQMATIFAVFQGGSSHRLLRRPGHSLAHIFVRTQHRGRLTPTLAILDEGLACLLEGSGRNPHGELATLRRRAGLTGPVNLDPTDLDYENPFSEAKGASFVAHVFARHGRRKLLRLLSATRGFTNGLRADASRWVRAVRTTLAVPLHELIGGWNESLAAAAGRDLFTHAEREACRKVTTQFLGAPLSRLEHWSWDAYRRAIGWTDGGRWILLYDGPSGWDVWQVARQRPDVMSGKDLFTGPGRQYAARVLRFFKARAAAVSRADTARLKLSYGDGFRSRPGFEARLNNLTALLSATQVDEVTPGLVVKAYRRFGEASEPVPFLVTLAKKDSMWQIVNEMPYPTASPPSAPLEPRKPEPVARNLQ